MVENPCTQRRRTSDGVPTPRRKGLIEMEINFEEFRFNQHADPELVYRFLAVFSRFEYALKLSPGLAKGDRSKVEADWDKFADFLSGHFERERTPELKTATDYLLDEPPQKQVLRGTALDWVPGLIADKTDLEALLLYVRRMRNNLFHGGKSQDKSPMQVDRNAALLSHGLTVLAECLRLSKTHQLAVVANFEAY